MQEAARCWCVDVRQIRPCAAQIREVEKGLRNQAAYILATELRRIGLTEQRTLQVMTRWNESNLPPLTVVELEGIVTSAFRKEKTYGCNGALANWCVGRPNCEYYQLFVAGKPPAIGRATMADFNRLGWRSPHITPAYRLIYHALIQLESARGFGPGGRLISSTRQVARLAGLSSSCVLQGLRFLDAMGLIDYQPGRKRATGLPPKGCTIHRVIPIPDPPVRNPKWGREVRRRLRSSSLEHRPSEDHMTGSLKTSYTFT